MSDALTARLLGAISTTLKNYVKPELSSDQSLIFVDVSLRMLEFLETRHSRLDSDIRVLLQKEYEVLKEVGELLASFSEHEAFAQSISETLSGAGSNVESTTTELEAMRVQFETLFSDAIPILFDLIENPDTAELGKGCLSSIVSSQKEFTFSQDPEIAKGMEVLYRGGRLDDDDAIEDESRPPIDEERLTRYLWEKFPDDVDVHAKDLTMVPGGFSKLTAFFTLCRPGKADQELAIRKDMPVSAIETTVTDEYPLLCKVHKAGFPVPEPQWLETDPSYFDGAFLVSTRSSGVNDISSWQTDPVATEGFVKELARVMAQLHKLDVAKLGFTADESGTSAGDHMLKEINKYYGFYKKHSDLPHPLLDFIFSWLQHNVPEYLFNQAPRIVHADIGFHNMLTENGKISALLDWEMSHLGDPIEDLFYSKLFVDQVTDWDTFTGYYQSFEGQSVPPESELFYSVWMGARNAAGCTRLRVLFESILPQEIKIALPGYIFGRRLEVDSSSKIIEGAGL